MVTESGTEREGKGAFPVLRACGAGWPFTWLLAKTGVLREVGAASVHSPGTREVRGTPEVPWPPKMPQEQLS